MYLKELKKYFEKKYITGSCFDNYQDLMKDKTLVDVNAPRALIAVELKGVWRGIKQLNEEKGILISKANKFY